MEINKLLFYGWDPTKPETKYPAMVERIRCELKTTNRSYLCREYHLARGYLYRIMQRLDTPTPAYAERLNSILDVQLRRGYDGRTTLTDRWRDRIKMYIKVSGRKRGTMSGLAAAVGMTVQHLYMIINRELKTLSTDKVEAINDYMRMHPTCPERRLPAVDILDAHHDDVLKLHAAGINASRIGRHYGVSRTTVTKWIAGQK